MINVRSSKSLESYVEREVQAIIPQDKKSGGGDHKSQSVEKNVEQKASRLDGSKTISKFELP